MTTSGGARAALTKHAHACVTLHAGGSTLLLDPGTFVPDRAELLAAADAVLVTHDHVDHVDVDAVSAALRQRRGLSLYGPPRVVDALRGAGADAAQLRSVADGDRLDVHGVAVRVVAGDHAPVHARVPVPHNAGYLLAGTVFHPGDSYRPPPFAVETLLVPVSGPWVKLGEAVDFVDAVAPTRSVAVHDVMLSDVGRSAVAAFLGEGGPTGRPLLVLSPGESLQL